MPLDNNGNYSRPGGKTAWQDDRDEDIPILASRHDEDGEDMAEAISQMLPKDGRAAMQGSLNMGGSKIQNLSDAAQAQDAATAKQVQTSAFCYGEDVSLTENEIQINLKPALTAVPNYIFLAVKVKNTNTGQTVLKINALPSLPVLYGEEEIYAGTLQADKVYYFAYNKALGAFQLILSGAPAVSNVPLFSFVMIESLLDEKNSKGWELQGTRCYRSKYWDSYDILLEEYQNSIDTQETITTVEIDSSGNTTQKQTVFNFKKNPDTLRRFYSKRDYDDRFDLTGDSGGFVLEEETTSFYLPKNKNFFRPDTEEENIGKFIDDTMRPIIGRAGQFGGEDKGDLGNGKHSEGALEIEYGGSKNTGNDANGAGIKSIKINSANLGTNYNGAETAPKHKPVFLYYRVANYMSPEISSAAEKAGEYAQMAEASAAIAAADASSARQSAQAAEEAAQSIDLTSLTSRIEALESELAALKANTKIIAGDNITIEEVSEQETTEEN